MEQFGESQAGQRTAGSTNGSVPEHRMVANKDRNRQRAAIRPESTPRSRSHQAALGIRICVERTPLDAGAYLAGALSRAAIVAYEGRSVFCSRFATVSASRITRS